MNAIGYSIFGYNNKHEGSLDFRSYLRGLHINLRVSELLYPDWKLHITTDYETFNAYSEYFRLINDRIELKIIDRQPLCLMMLYRLYPIFLDQYNEVKYERVICRDSDSLLSYRERQAVQYWQNGTKMAHAITDSISHSITLMGGMIGFKSGNFRDRMAVQTFDDLIAISQGIDWNVKGADQVFLNRYVLPRVADSITEHFVLGHPQTFRGDCHNFIHDVDLGLPQEYKELNHLGWHIGASGFQTDQTILFLKKHGKNNDFYEDVEKQFPEIFYWMI